MDIIVVRRVYAKIDTPKLKAPHKAAEYAFAHFCERVQMLVGKNTRTLLIGDLDAQQASTTIREFSEYRVKGTPWEYGIEIGSIVDCVHFAHSQQLADVYLFAATHRHSGRKGEMADKFTAALNERDIGPQRYKDWPS